MFTKSKLVLHGLALALVIGAASQAVAAGEAFEGKIIADQRGRISAQMTGERSQLVKDMRVRAGDTVKKGDLLAQLDTEQLEADRLIAQRALEEAQASVEVEKANVARAQLDYDRKAGLKDSPSFNRAEFEDSAVELRAAESRLQSAQSSANRRQAEVARIDLEIRLAEIKAPYDGLVLDILTTVGASVTQRAPDLLTLLDLDQVEIALPLPEREAQRLKPGQSFNYVLADGVKRTARLRTVLPPMGAQEANPVARLQLDSANFPPLIRHQQPAQVYLGD